MEKTTEFVNVELAQPEQRQQGNVFLSDDLLTKDNSVLLQAGETAFDESSISSATAKPKLQKYPFFVFLIIGCAQLLGWNSMLNGMAPMFITVFETTDYTVTVTAVYSTTLAIITIVFMFVNIVNLYSLYIGLVLSATLALVFGLIAQFSTASSAPALFHGLAGATAIYAALIGSSAFGYAAQFPVDYSGAMSAGLGLAGVVTFTFWMIGNHAAFDGTTPDGTRSSIWLLCGVMIALSLIAIVLAWSLFRQEWVQALFNKQSDVKGEEVIVEEGTYEREGIKGVLKRSGWMGAMNVLLFTCSLSLFPTFGPLAWYEVKGNEYKAEHNTDQVPNSFNIQRDTLIGLFQVCDLISRYLPTVVPFLNVNSKVTTAIVLGRFLFFIPFILSATLTSTFFSQFWFLFIEQMLMTLTNGWMSTVIFARIFETVEGGEAKARVASFALLCTFVGIAAGQWFGFGLKKAIIG